MELVARGCGLTFHPVFLYEALLYEVPKPLWTPSPPWLVSGEDWTLAWTFSWMAWTRQENWEAAVQSKLSMRLWIIQQMYTRFRWKGLWQDGLFCKLSPGQQGFNMLHIATTFTNSFLKLWMFFLDQRYVVGPFWMKRLLFSVTFESLFLHEKLRSITLHTSEIS